MFINKYPIETINIIIAFWVLLIVLISQIIKSITLLNRNTIQNSLYLKFISIILHKFKIVLVESKKAKFCPGILVNKYPRTILPNKEEIITISDILKVKCLTITSFFLFLFLNQLKNPCICEGTNITSEKIKIPYKPFN